MPLNRLVHCPSPVGQALVLEIVNEHAFQGIVTRVKPTHQVDGLVRTHTLHVVPFRRFYP